MAITTAAAPQSPARPRRTMATLSALNVGMALLVAGAAMWVVLPRNVLVICTFLSVLSACIYVFHACLFVPPYKKIVLASPTSGDYKILQPGLHVLQPLQVFFGHQVTNPFDGSEFWPSQGQRLLFDPQRISVNCRLEGRKGTAAGFCDVKILLTIGSDCARDVSQVSEFLKQVPDHESMNTIVNGLTNEFVRSICHGLDYEQCNVQQVFENLMAEKHQLTESLAKLCVSVDSFEVEQLCFALDKDKKRLDQEEYKLIRCCMNKKREQEIISMEAENDLKKARAKGSVLLEEARCQAEAEKMTQRAVDEQIELHAKRMVELLSATHFTEMQRSQIVGKALGRNRVHLIPASAIFSARDFRSAVEDKDSLVKL